MISHVFKEMNRSKKEDVIARLKPHKIKNDIGVVHRTLAMVKETMNPFDSEVDSGHFYNIGTGETVSDNREISTYCC